MSVPCLEEPTHVENDLLRGKTDSLKTESVKTESVDQDQGCLDHVHEDWVWEDLVCEDLVCGVGGKNANPYWCEIRELTNWVKYPNSKSIFCIATKYAKNYRSVKFTNFFFQQFLMNTRIFVLFVNIRNFLICSNWEIHEFLSRLWISEFLKVQIWEKTEFLTLVFEKYTIRVFTWSTCDLTES